MKDLLDANEAFSQDLELFSSTIPQGELPSYQPLPTTFNPQDFNPANKGNFNPNQAVQHQTRYQPLLEASTRGYDDVFNRYEGSLHQWIRHQPAPSSLVDLQLSQWGSSDVLASDWNIGGLGVLDQDLSLLPSGDPVGLQQGLITGEPGTQVCCVNGFAPKG